MAEYIDLDTPLEVKVARGSTFEPYTSTLRELLDVNHIPYTAADVVERNKWIPVTERLPENGEYVLCFCRANIVCVLRRDKDGDWYENPAHVYMSGFVTHWMPLPKAPEKESES